jgi:hypothetical protein
MKRKLLFRALLVGGITIVLGACLSVDSDWLNAVGGMLPAELTITNETEFPIANYVVESPNEEFQAYTEAINIPPGGQATIDVPGNETKVTVNINYQGEFVPVTEIMTFMGSASYEWTVTETMWVRPVGDPYGYLDPYGYAGGYAYLFPAIASTK